MALQRQSSQGPGNFSRSQPTQVFDDSRNACKKLEARILKKRPEADKAKVRAFMNDVYAQPKKHSLRAVTSGEWGAQNLAVEQRPLSDLPSALDVIVKLKSAGGERKARVRAQQAVAAHGSSKAHDQLVEEAKASAAKGDGVEKQDGEGVAAVVDYAAKARKSVEEIALKAAELLRGITSSSSWPTASAPNSAVGAFGAVAGTSRSAAISKAPPSHKGVKELRDKLIEVSTLNVKDLRGALVTAELPFSGLTKDLLLTRLRAYWIEKKAPVGYRVQTYVAGIKLRVVEELKAELSKIGQETGGKNKAMMQSELISLYQSREWPLASVSSSVATAARRGSAEKRQRGAESDGARTKRSRKTRAQIRVKKTTTRQCECDCKRRFPKADTKWIQWRKKERVYDLYKSRNFIKFRDKEHEFKSPFKCLGHAVAMRKYWCDHNLP